MEQSIDIMYDETEMAPARFIGFVGEHGRFDLAIITTNNFFGKKIVHCLQTGRSAILNAEEAEQADYIQTTFQVSEEEASELSLFLSANL